MASIKGTRTAGSERIRRFGQDCKTLYLLSKKVVSVK